MKQSPKIAASQPSQNMALVTLQKMTSVSMNGWVALDKSTSKTYNCNLTPQQVQQQMALAEDFDEADKKCVGL